MTTTHALRVGTHTVAFVCSAALNPGYTGLAMRVAGHGMSVIVAA